MARPTLSVIMPVYNEAPYIAACLERVFERGKPDQVIVVDDGSSDGTGAQIQASPFANRFELIRHANNRGKGAAIRTALPLVHCETVIIQDGDLEYDPADYDRLLAAMQRTGSAVVYGSRHLSFLNPYSTFGFYVGGRTLSALANALFGLRLTDVPTCYKLFRTELLRQIPLRAERFEFCAEVTGFLGRIGVSIPEVPIRYLPRSRAEGKKITPRDGLLAMRMLLQQRMVSLEELLADSHASVAARPAERATASGPTAPTGWAQAVFGLTDLLQMQEAHNYARWLLERFAPYMGDHLLETHAGVGALTVPLLRAGKRVTACESSAWCAQMLQSRAGESSDLELLFGAFGSRDVDQQLGTRSFEAVLCVNALAATDDPDALLASAYRRLRPGGRLLLFVPAVGFAYGAIDRKVGHRRRFSRTELESLLRAQPWVIEVLRFTNPIGLLAWTLNSRLLGRQRQSVPQILAFDRLAVPLQREIERQVTVPTGQSLLVVARRP